MFSVLRTLQKNASSTANGRFLERRTVVAIAAGLMVVTIAVAGSVGMSGVMAVEDDSNVGFWLAERARQTTRQLFNHQAIIPVEKAVLKKTAPAPKRVANPVHAATGSQSICVRMCDGFYFPVGRMGGAADVAEHEAVCQSQCPGAQTSLYVMRNSRIEDAVSARTGQLYERLKVAYQHTKTRDNTCSCKAAGSVIQASVPLSRDITMRRGDSVMTERGVRVFRGKTAKSAKASDFVALSQSKDIDPQKRKLLTALERVSAPRLASLRERAPVSTRAMQSPQSPPLYSAPSNKSVRLIGDNVIMSQ